jgi:SAM-dependent methyltransferase
MGAAIKLMDKRALALAGAKFRAWWEGAPYDEAAALAALDKPAEPEHADVANDLFDTPADPRLSALQRIWGEGRLGPESAPALVEAGEGAAVALIGPGLASVVAPYAGYATIYVHEWRSETLEPLKAGLMTSGLERAQPAAFDMDLTNLPAEVCDAVVSFDEFTYAANPMRLALQIARSLKPGAKAVVETYAGAAGQDIASAFASAFAEPQLHPRNTLLHAMNEAGLDVEADEDISLAHAAAARKAFETFTERSAALKPPTAIELREIGWEITTWRARLHALALGRIQRHRFVVHRRP